MLIFHWVLSFSFICISLFARSVWKVMVWLCCVSYEQKKDKRIVLSSRIIYREHITEILAFCKHCIFSLCLFVMSFTNELLETNNDQQINLKYFVWFWKTPSQALKYFSNSISLPPYNKQVVLHCHRVWKWQVMRWKVIPGVGCLQETIERSIFSG